jgi:hypothetical protein
MIAMTIHACTRHVHAGMPVDILDAAALTNVIEFSRLQGSEWISGYSACSLLPHVPLG